MAKLISNEFDRANYLWLETEARLADAVKRWMTPEQADVQRRAMWEKMHMQFKDLEHFGQQIPRVPEPSTLLKQEMEKKKYEQLQEAHQQEAARKARVEHMQSAAMACSITDGLNLWVARWGDGWVLVMDVQKARNEADAFRWDVLQTRLTRTHRLEIDGEYVRVVT